MPEPRGTSQEEDYDLFAHMDFEEERDDEEDELDVDYAEEPERSEPV